MHGVTLHIWGDYACFTRPEMKAERVSYDVITPSAARGIVEAIHWKPAIRWHIDRIRVLNPIRFETIRRNEVGSKIPTKGKTGIGNAMKTGDLSSLRLNVDEDRQQRASVVLRDVAYVVEAHFEMTDKAKGDTPAKHAEMVRRRAEKGQCFHRPCLGTREFDAHFELLEPGAVVEDRLQDRSRDLGWMLYDIDFQNDRTPLFFRAEMQDGIIDVAAARDRGLVA